MSPLERAWVGLVNSPPIRNLRSFGPVQRLLRAGVLERADDRMRSVVESHLFLARYRANIEAGSVGP